MWAYRCASDRTRRFVWFYCSCMANATRRATRSREDRALDVRPGLQRRAAIIRSMLRATCGQSVTQTGSSQGSGVEGSRKMPSPFFCDFLQIRRSRLPRTRDTWIGTTDVVLSGPIHCGPFVLRVNVQETHIHPLSSFPFDTPTRLAI